MSASPGTWRAGAYRLAYRKGEDFGTGCYARTYDIRSITMTSHIPSIRYDIAYHEMVRGPLRCSCCRRATGRAPNPPSFPIACLSTCRLPVDCLTSARARRDARPPCPMRPRRGRARRDARRAEIVYRAPRRRHPSPHATHTCDPTAPTPASVRPRTQAILTRPTPPPPRVRVRIKHRHHQRARRRRASVEEQEQVEAEEGRSPSPISGPSSGTNVAAGSRLGR